MSDLAQARDDLLAWLPVVQALTAEPDTDGHAGRSKPGSRPPWNGEAAMLLFTIHAGVREVEQELRHDVTGRPARECRRTGWSDGNTARAVDAIAKLGEAAGAELAGDAEWQLTAWATQIMQLPAVDLEERPQRVRAKCPYCHAPMLRVLPRSGRVTCLRYGACQDSDGNHPVGEIGRSQLDGSPMVAWRDGLVT